MEAECDSYQAREDWRKEVHSHKRAYQLAGLLEERRRLPPGRTESEQELREVFATGRRYAHIALRHVETAQ
jgi:hypothetical protein